MSHPMRYFFHFLVFIHFSKNLLYCFNFGEYFKVHLHIDLVINSFHFCLAIILAIFRYRLIAKYFYLHIQ